MKKLLTLLLIMGLAISAVSAIDSKSLGPPGDIVAFAAPEGYVVTAMDEKAINGITLAGLDLATRAALDAIAVTILTAAIVAASAYSIHNDQRKRGEHLPSGGIGYRARDQTAFA